MEIYFKRRVCLMFIALRKSGKLKLMRLLQKIMRQYQNEEEVIIIEVPNTRYSMNDISIVVTEFNNFIERDGKTLDYGFSMKEDTIKMKLIIEDKIAV
jgi:hypothetical protein